jgi:hypothetical protein
MTATATLRFDQYILRPAGDGERDWQLARKWVAADPDHRGQDPIFWLEQGDGIDSWLLLDDKGPLYFAKLVLFPSRRGVELHIQFPPTGTRLMRRRVSLGLVKGLAWLEKTLRQVGIEAIVFQSQNRSLIQFSVARLGFEREGDRLLTKRIDAA